ncbi:saccharopine dehydrogenase family protein [Gordonia soli]|uniref:Saccharopine dehydrogenase NADP binding domain-containing protein n=1 Tax=Gordonia soli NBRC 108243 TaxID=1223545 RepID=M0QEM8_9ACTN|nr:saccharopine dehydrogenase NADP-binding domain-containing protein [Gordonia soli]GAC66781.1 hypothetical protein GS4_04_00380 [Gordonia soli NBRC 108243]
MRVLALGAGEVGGAAIRALGIDDEITHIEIADRDLAAATAVAESIPGAHPRALDVSDHEALVAAMADADLVLNTVGPFFRFGPPVVRAAIEARCDYIDICDDPDPTLEMLDLDAEARDAGICVLIGMGASPGLANLLAMAAADRLDTVETIITGWNIDAAHPEEARKKGQPVSAALVHGMQQISGSIPVIRDGERTQRSPLESIRVDYPGLGVHTCHSFGHPEPLTLHRALPQLRDSSNVVVGDRIMMGALKTVQWGIDHTPLGLDAAARISDLFNRVHVPVPADLMRPGGLPPLFAVATGTHNGEAATAATALAQTPGFSMAETTGVPMATAARLMPSVRRPGVHTPETLIPADKFFTAMAPHCIGAPSPSAMTVTTCSWESEEQSREHLSGQLMTSLLVG